MDCSTSSIEIEIEIDINRHQALKWSQMFFGVVRSCTGENALPEESFACYRIWSPVLWRFRLTIQGEHAKEGGFNGRWPAEGGVGRRGGRTLRALACVGFIAILSLGHAPRAQALTEVSIEVITAKGTGYSNLAGLMMAPMMAMADLLSQGVWAYDGHDQYFGFEKELDFFLATESPASHRFNLLWFVTPQILFNADQPGEHRIKLRAGLHQEILFGAGNPVRRDPVGRFGLTVGAGVSVGRQLEVGGLVAAGVDAKLFYHFKSARLTRFILGTRYEYGNLGHEVNVYLGFTLAF